MSIDIVARMRKIREENGVTQQWVADAIGIPLKRYQAYEQGRAEPSLGTLMELRILYGFKSLDDLLMSKQSKKRQSAIEDAYLKASLDKRKIVDFVLGV